jgi:hypothetical protein
VKIPEGFDLAAHRFVSDSSKATGKLLHDEGSRGDSRADDLLVRINPDRPKTAVAETLLHETMHCIWSATALRGHAAEEHEEAIVTGLAPLLLEVLRRNPDLVEFLVSA